MDTMKHMFEFKPINMMQGSTPFCLQKWTNAVSALCGTIVAMLSTRSTCISLPWV